LRHQLEVLLRRKPKPRLRNRDWIRAAPVATGIVTDR
jgi:hypothetical protein